MMKEKGTVQFKQGLKERYDELNFIAGGNLVYRRGLFADVSNG